MAGTGSRVAALAGALAALLAAPAAAAAPTLEAQVDRTEIALDELVMLEVSLTGASGKPSWEFPRTPDFEVVSQGRFQESKGTLGSGGLKLVETHTVVHHLKPTRTGALTVPAVSVVVEGQRYATQPIVVNVSAARGGEPEPRAGAPDAGGDPRRAGPAPRGGWAYRNWQRDVALRMEVGKAEVFVGEQIMADAWLLTPYRAADFRPENAPSYDGFWRENLEVPGRLREQQRGAQWAYLLSRAALFPRRHGTLTIEPLAGRAVIALRGGSFSPFGETVQVPLASAPVTVRVKPLPPGAPPGFEPGNVGALSLRTSATPERVAVGEPVTVQFTIEGDGNVRALSPPRLPQLPGAHAYQPATTDRTEVRGGRLFGTRVVETVVIPDRAGTLTIPALEWPFFDPRSGKYQVATTPSITVTVEPPSAEPRDPSAPAPDVAARLRPIRADGELRRAGPPPWRRPWFLALLVAPPLAFAAALATGRFRARAGAPSGAGREARRRLLSARRRRARDPAAAAAEAERALLAYASGRIGASAAGLTRDALAAALTDAGAHAPAVRALLQALERVDAARYGAGDANDEEILAAAERAIDALDEADWRTAREVSA